MHLWILGILFIAMGLIPTLVNGSTFLRGILEKENGSIIPIFGGVTLSIGLLIIPVEGLKPWAWIPLVLDFGCLPSLVMLLISKKKE
ncbi:MAG: hypothetical protein ACPGN3_08605 [Opitutales bacterium]